jgi:hypothetical protein
MPGVQHTVTGRRQGSGLRKSPALRLPDSGAVCQMSIV